MKKVIEEFGDLVGKTITCARKLGEGSQVLLAGEDWVAVTNVDLGYPEDSECEVYLASDPSRFLSLDEAFELGVIDEEKYLSRLEEQRQHAIRTAALERRRRRKLYEELRIKLEELRSEREKELGAIPEIQPEKDARLLDVDHQAEKVRRSYAFPLVEEDNDAPS